MFKKTLSILLSVIILSGALSAAPFTVNAQEAQIAEVGESSGVTGDCTWTLNGTELIISGNGAMGDYDFLYTNHSPWPTTITKLTITKGVTSVGTFAFQNCCYLTSVTIPDSVTSIGDSAFDSCSGLTSVYIPDSVTSIGNNAFVSCTSLTSVVIPDSVTHIGYYAFEYCSSLTDVSLPDSVTYIGNYAFYSCSSLTDVSFPDFVKRISDSAFYETAWYNNQPDGLIYAGKVAYKMKGNCPAEVKIKYGTLGIGHNAFYACSSLTAVDIPDSVTSIDVGAFYKCTGLTSVTIPASVTTIGDRAFACCSSLNAVDIPDSVTSIGDCAFDETAWYHNQPDGLVYAGKVAYKMKGDCPAEVKIKNGTLGIGDFAFDSCSSLTSVAIPDSVTSIGDCVFYDCSSLTAVIIPDSVTSIGDCAFYDCSSLTAVDIPDSVTSIGSSAFYGCSSLTSVIIPDSVTSIEPNTFKDCSSLTSIYIPYTVTSISKNAFSGCTKLNTIMCNPDSAAAKYAQDNGIDYIFTLLCKSCRKTIDKYTRGYPATCTETGLTSSYQCPFCGYYQAQTVIPIVHNPAELVVENIINATCTANGRCDEVYYCTECGTEISRTAKTTPALGHSYEVVLSKPAGYFYVGLTDGVKCSHCGDWLIEQQEIPMLEGEGVFCDVDGDGEVSAVDVTIIQRNVSSIPIPFEMDDAKADADEDGIVTIMDASFIQRWLCQLKTTDNIGRLIG